MSSYRIGIRLSPHSTGLGDDADWDAIGGKVEHAFRVEAQDFGEAHKMAKCFAEGMQRLPRVWIARITSISEESWP